MGRNHINASSSSISNQAAFITEAPDEYLINERTTESPRVKIQDYLRLKAGVTGGFKSDRNNEPLGVLMQRNNTFTNAYQTTTKHILRQQLPLKPTSRNPHRLNELSSKYNDAALSDAQIRFVSMIDSKPVQPPYLSLVPFKNFGKGDQQVPLKDGDNRSRNPNFKWSRLLHEDLEELLKQKASIPLVQEPIKRLS